MIKHRHEFLAELLGPLLSIFLAQRFTVVDFSEWVV